MTRHSSVQDYAHKLAEHAKRLETFSAVVGAGEPCARDVEVKKIAARCSELVRGASALGVQENGIALAVIGRTMVQSLILILWVCVSEENATHQSQAGLAEFTRVARINLEQGKLKIRNRETGEDATAEFLKTDKFKKVPLAKKVIDQAVEAGVEDLYQVFYRFMSLATHGHDMIDGEEDPAAGLMVDLQTIGVISVGVGFVAAKWLLCRTRTDGHSLRMVLGIAE